MSAFNGSPGPGVYTWLHAGGSFPVSLRPNGVFHCQNFPALASWQDEQQRRIVDWKQYGKYEFALAADGSLEGGAVGNHANWRKMLFLRPFTAPESKLMAGPGGSAWDFQWEKGSFEVEFRCDGFNHFHCTSFPEHSHWSMDETGKMTINFGKYGDYEMLIDPTTQTMSGNKIGEHDVIECLLIIFIIIFLLPPPPPIPLPGQPENWRKARFLRPLGAEVLSSGHSHDHEAHDEHCGHAH